MVAKVELSPQLAHLARAVGLLSAEGRVESGWFGDPLHYLRRLLSDPQQRAALLQLLDDLLPPDTAGDTLARWHPLLDPAWPGNLYVTIDGDVVGLAGSIATAPGTVPAASASLRIPLVDLSSGEVEVIAGSARGPLEASIRAGWDAAAHPSAVAVHASIDLQGQGQLRIVFDDLDPAQPGGRTEIDPTRLDGAAARALLQLVADALAALPVGEPRVARVIAHLPGLLGLDPALQPLPVGDLLRDPDAVARWFTGIVASPAALRAWFTHAAGLFGAGLPAAQPMVEGNGDADDPLRTPLIVLEGGAVALELRLGVGAAPGGARELLAGIGLVLATPLAQVEAVATLLALPLGGGDARPLPSAQLRLLTASAPLVDAAPAVRLEAVAAGLAWDGRQLRPALELVGVTLDGKDYARLDLGDAQAVGEAASAVVAGEIDSLLGQAGSGHALQALLGLVAPADDAQSPHRLALPALAQSPTRAIAGFHRAVLADAAHPWRHLFAELARLLQAPQPVEGAGRADDPWRFALAVLGPARVEVAAWNARDSATPAGTERLRLGLRLGVDATPWAFGGLVELLAADLRPETDSALAFLGGLHAMLRLEPPALPVCASGLRLALAALSARASFATAGAVAPAAGFAWQIEASGLVVEGRGGTVGPLQLLLPAALDGQAADLGLGVPPDALVGLLRLLLAQLLFEAGGPPAFAAGALVGLHRALRELPDDWPLLAPPVAGDVASLFGDPLGALRAHLQRIAGGVSADGTPFVVAALPCLHGLLAAAWPGRPADALSGLRPAGLGRAAAPWALPVLDTPLELLAWLEPDGPPPAWLRGAAARVPAGAGAASFVGLLRALAPLAPTVADALHARDPSELATRLAQLAGWLASGDGLVPLAAQVVPGPGWTAGAAVSAPHHELPAAPAAIAQVRDQLDAWAGNAPCAVLLLAPALAGRSAWDALLQAVEPGRAATAHFDFRVPGADPLTLPLDTVEVVARHYTVDLADAEPDAMASQLGRAADRVRHLTGVARVLLVAHSSAGVVARRFALQRPDAVGGVVTLGTPHAASPAAGCLDPTLADAVRLADALLPAQGRSAVGRAVGRLAGLLDGQGGGSTPVPPRPRAAADPVPGLAIPGVLDGDLLADLAGAAAARFADALATAAAPRQAAFGLRWRSVLAGDEPEALAAELDLRVDAWRASLGTPAAAGPRAIELRLRLRREGGWLVGGPGDDTPLRLRWAEFGARVAEAEGGGFAVQPILRLHEVGAPLRACVEADELIALAEALPARLPFEADADADAEAGSADALLVALLRAAGLLVRDATGRSAWSVEALIALLREPAAWLGERLPALVDVLAERLGAEPAADGWSLRPGDGPLAIMLTRAPWALQLRTQDLAGAAGELALAPGLGLAVEASLGLPGFAASAAARLRLGGAVLGWDAAAGTLMLDDGSAASALTLLPAPAGPLLRDALLQRLPPLLAGGLASAVLEAATDGRLRLRGLARLFAAPADWLRSTDGFGAAGGGFDAGRIGGLLAAIGRAVDPAAPPAPGTLALPGGLVLTAAGGDPLQLALAGTLALGGGDTLALQLELALDRRLDASPSGSATFTVTLPGTWGRIAVTLGADASGLALSVAPSGAQAIELLPHFSGFGALAGGAALLLPRVLQAAVDALAPVPQNASGLLRSGLSLARALGVYDFDAQGFEEQQRAAELAAMLQPGWIERKAASGPAVAGLIADLLGGPAPLVPVPGRVDHAGATVSWSYPADAIGTLSVALGWSGPGAEPSLRVGLGGLRIGPVVVDALSAGYDGGITCSVALHLEPGGPIGFLQPALSFDVAGARVAFELQPLGAAERDDFAIRLAPEPALVLQPEAALALLERWGLPLAVQLLVHELADALPTPVWPGGPTIRSVLDQAGLVVPGSTPPRVAATLPPVAEGLLRALAALVSNVDIELTPDGLTLSLVEQSGRRGLRLHGRQPLDAGDTVVELRFGEADWLDDPAAGLTLWLLEAAPGMPPVRFAPALDVTGFGLVVSGSDGPLLDGGFALDGVGGFVFVGLDFLDAARRPALAVHGLGAGVQLIDARVNVASDDGDGLLQKLLPKELAAGFGLAVAYRDGRGLEIHGGSQGGGLELTFPLDLDLVVLRLEELYLALRAQGGSAVIEAALSGSSSLGPIFAFVKRVGLRLTMDAAGTRLGFRMPDGLALSIDAGPVSGGGFLYIDEARGRYAGALQLELQTISLTAIGLLDTRLPDGSPIPGLGFSLLVIICVELPPIQLGFGFTLNGIGGLLGLNRTMDLAALRAGVRNRALEAMLFPPDPIRNADAVVRTLTTVFPVAPDRFVVGPMVRLGWGTPSILTLDLAILLELPEPIRLAILGRIKLALPQDDESAVVLIHLDVAGTLDFERGEVSIDAVLYDSKIAAFTLSGEMALRARWKQDPTFVLAIGGFHPAFPTPVDFPSLARFAISLATGDNPRLRLEAYLAVTSNTLQFGAALDVHAEAAGFAIDGHLGFDALIQFDPFGLQADMSASFSVTWEGDTICAIRADVHLTGPSPWHAWGKARVQLLFMSAEVSFDARIGEAELPPPPPPVRVVDLVLAAVAEPANWSAQPPAGEGVVALRSAPASAGVLVHPLGGLSFRQRVAPLGVTLERFGAAAVDGPSRLEIGDVHLGGDVIAADARQAQRDPFAPAQFLQMSDDAKLSRPSFEAFDSGVALRFDSWQIDEAGAGEAAPLDYEVIVVDEQEDGSAPASTRLPGALAAAAASQGAAALARSGRGGARRFQATALPLAVGEPRTRREPETIE